MLSAQTIADVYRSRWKIELFFKWIKQHLRIKSFYGCSENAVRTQIWIAVTAYLLVAIVKKVLPEGFRELNVPRRQHFAHLGKFHGR